jgi:Spy/CpxP family protein refolding chaperone
MGNELAGRCSARRVGLLGFVAAVVAVVPAMMAAVVATGVRGSLGQGSKRPQHGNGGKHQLFHGEMGLGLMMAQTYFSNMMRT